MTAPYDRIVTVDFETRWDSKEYTLSKMTTEEYIRDERFKAFGVCFKDITDKNGATWVRGHQIQKWADSMDWSRTAVLAHNAQFDVSILMWRYGVKPAFIFDTLSMARALRGVEVGNSLMKLAEAFNLPPKGNAVHSTNGMVDISLEVERELADYCRHDVFLCEEIFKRLIVGYPVKELQLIDMTVRMYAEPLLELDPVMLKDAIEDEKEKRGLLLARLGVDDASLSSNDKFAEILAAMGVEPPTKISKTTGKQAFALAKNDALFQALMNGDNEDVALLCEARLAVKSTLERTRGQRFFDIAQRGTLPVPLNYYGAITGRWTATKGGGINMQNMKRGSFLRKAIMAPEGHTLVVGDLSQIEPRVLAWLSSYDELLDIFRSGKDAYAMFGAQMFNIPGMTKDTHPVQRQSAKSALLGAGYGLGWASFAAQLLTGFLGAPPLRYTKADAKQLGVTAEKALKFQSWPDNMRKMAEIPHTCTEEELFIHCVTAKEIIDKYRAAASPVTSFWEMCGNWIAESLYGGKEQVYKCLTFRKEEIVLPSGMSLRYPNLRQVREKVINEKGEEVEGQMQWVYGDTFTKLYPGKLTNNITQAVARIVMTDGMLRVGKRYPVKGTVHDELIAVVPETEVSEAEPWVLAQMIKEPKYMPGIPLNAETGAARRYGDAK